MLNILIFLLIFLISMILVLYLYKKCLVFWMHKKMPKACKKMVREKGFYENKLEAIKNAKQEALEIKKRAREIEKEIQELKQSGKLEEELQKNPDKTIEFFDGGFSVIFGLKKLENGTEFFNKFYEKFTFQNNICYEKNSVETSEKKKCDLKAVFEFHNMYLSKNFEQTLEGSFSAEEYTFEYEKKRSEASFYQNLKKFKNGLLKADSKMIETNAPDYDGKNSNFFDYFENFSSKNKKINFKISEHSHIDSVLIVYKKILLNIFEIRIQDAYFYLADRGFTFFLRDHNIFGLKIIITPSFKLKRYVWSFK